MPYLAGIVLALAVSGLANLVGLDRGRTFYPTVLVVIASYYVLFAVMGGSGRALVTLSHPSSAKCNPRTVKCNPGGAVVLPGEVVVVSDNVVARPDGDHVVSGNYVVVPVETECDPEEFRVCPWQLSA